MLLIHASAHHVIPAVLYTLVDTFLLSSHHVEQVLIANWLFELAGTVSCLQSLSIGQRYGHIAHIPHIVHAVKRSIVLGVRILHILHCLPIPISMLLTSAPLLMVLQFDVTAKVGT